MKNVYLILLLVACVMPMRAETAAADTVATELKEVVVKSERAWIEGEKVVFIPNKREKNLSNSPESLLKMMHLPTVRIIDGKAIGLNGQDVVYFINGVRAESTDIATFWPKQAKRVEYMENPTDPRYEGCAAVVNFVMTEYEVGGVTRINARQEIPNEGSYSAANKLVYHKMTYGVMFDGGYSRDHSSSYSGEDNYAGIYYGGNYYDNVKREYDGHSWSRNDRISAGLNARYVTDKVKITHTLGFRWNRNPGSGSFDTESWSPELFKSSSALSQSSGRSASPQLSGSYGIWINPKWHIYSQWNYGYSHKDNSSMYRNGELDPIYNASEEDVHTAGLSLQPTFQPSKKFFVQLIATSSMNWFSTRYAGSADQKVDQWRGETRTTLRFAWIPSDNFWMDLKPGVTATYWKVSDLDRYSKVEPRGQLGLFWRISRKLRFSANLFYSSDMPSASQSGDVLVRQSELMWLRGNPALVNETSWSPHINLTWLGTDWFNAALFGSYRRENNTLVSSYTAADAEQGGVVNTYINGGSADSYHLGGSFSVDLFSNRLNLHLQPEYHYYKTHGEYANDIGRFRIRGSAGYTINDHCSVNIGYDGTEKGLDKSGMERCWYSDDWWASFSYGNGDLYLSVIINDIFNKNRKSWRELNSGIYSSIRHNLSIGRCLRIYLSYTFGYGKKVEKGIDIDSPQEIESGVVGSD